MTFNWVIKHQKKVLFVLAGVLVVGWGLQGTLSRLLGGRSPKSGREAVARIAGEDVSYGEFINFKRSWARVFPETIGRYVMDTRYAGRDVTLDDVAWAYLGLCKLAEQTGVSVSDRRVLEFKRAIFRRHMGRQAQLSDTAQVKRWLRERMGMTGQQLDYILRQRLMAETMLRDLLEALHPTDAEAWEQYREENRAVRVKYVAFRRNAFLAQVNSPTEEEIKGYYDAHKGPGRAYFSPPTVQIEYAQVSVRKLEAGVTVTVEEIKKYYDGNKDLYLIKGAAAEGAEAEYLPFPEVKPEIEAVLRRRRAREKAVAIMNGLRKAYQETVGAELEALVKARKEKALEYFRTPALGEVELLELPDIRMAGADGKSLVQLAFELDAKKQELSPVLTSPEARFVFRPIDVPQPARTPELAEVKERVVSDIRKGRAFLKAVEAAGDFREELIKKDGASKFEECAGRRGLTVGQTPFFVNNFYDVNRPAFIDRASPLEVGESYGPMPSARDGVAAVVKVVEEREADSAGFAGERKLKRRQVLDSKVAEFRWAVFPKGVLEFAGYEDLTPPPKSLSE